jgi:ubiquitin-like-conjugating enzyme ATG10
MPLAFPHLGEAEFDQGCVRLLQRFEQVCSTQTEWLSAEKMRRHETVLLRITKPLTRGVRSSKNGVEGLERPEEGGTLAGDDELGVDGELEEDDEVRWPSCSGTTCHLSS